MAMKTIRNACKLQPNALEINVGDQIEQLDQIIVSFLNSITPYI
jgi:hypothetical protein